MALVEKPSIASLSCLFLCPNSFLCNPNVLSIRSFSTARVKKITTPSPEIYDVLVHNHQFSPELAAALASSRLPKSTTPGRADSVLSFLKEKSFTTAQLQKLVGYYPRILGLTIEGFEFRFKPFRDLGLSSEEIAKIISNNQMILQLSMASNIIPKLSMLKGLLGSNEEVARLLKNCAWFVLSDLEKKLMPNVEILKSCSIPMERIVHFLHSEPRCFLVKSDIMRKSADKAIEFGVSRTSVVFIHALKVLSFTGEETWEVKMETLRDLGFSDDDIFTMFRNHPNVFGALAKTMKNKIDVLLATGKYNISDIVAFPAALGFSIEKRLEPRIQILRCLESRNLIEKWPALSGLSRSTNDRFFDSFVRPYCDEIGRECITKICQGQREMKLSVDVQETCMKS
ncbi:uncharacterized protein LOC131019099 [Salvia miltiorrhiza]|uniref:uncharacterized protein LOC131019099 n=1 Tax=Salvia miltiorrhiza TaxID=226208 RepID=UPI0025AD4DCD|nr:uncharacterized protein LOC131019099 [Salvia miltiorrhiza]